MPLTPEQIAAAGPWAVLVAILLAGIVALFGLIVKKLLVPGWIYDRAEAERQKSDIQAERNSEALEATAKTGEVQAKAIADLAESFRVMARNYDRIDLRLEALERGRVKHE